MREGRQATMLDQDEVPADLRTRWRYDILIPYLEYIGRQAAIQVGVHRNDLDDCEITFVERMLLKSEEKLRANIARGAFGWLKTCARNHARNFLRNIASHERNIAVVADRSAQASKMKICHQQPEQCFLKTSLIRDLADCVSDLKPEVRQMLLRHYLQDEPIAEIASSFGRSRNATDQAMFRAKLAIREHMERRGVEASDFAAIFA